MLIAVPDVEKQTRKDKESRGMMQLSVEEYLCRSCSGSFDGKCSANVELNCLP